MCTKAQVAYKTPPPWTTLTRTPSMRCDNNVILIIVAVCLRWESYTYCADKYEYGHSPLNGWCCKDSRYHGMARQRWKPWLG